VRSEDLFHIAKERNFPHALEIRIASWFVQILRRNWFIAHVIEGKIVGRIAGTRRQGRRRRQLLDGLKEMRRF